MWLTSIPSVCTLWLMANALALPIYTPTHTHTRRWTHQPLRPPNAFCLNSHANLCVPVCAGVRMSEWNAKALLWIWSAISLKADRDNSGKIHTQSCNFTPSHFSLTQMCPWGGEWDNDTSRDRAGERGSDRATDMKTVRERAKGRQDESRTDQGNILPVIVCKNQSGKTDGNWVFAGLKETHRSILKMAV